MFALFVILVFIMILDKTVGNLMHKLKKCCCGKKNSEID